jgi:hypothetical protein
MIQAYDTGLRKSAAVLLLLFFTIGTLNAVSSTTEANDNGGSRTVMLELFTASWCAGCPYADEAAEMLLVDYGPERLSLVQYHYQIPDQLATPETNDRGNDYNAGVTGLPAAWFDGTDGPNTGVQASVENFYNLFKSKIDTRLKTSSPIDITVSMTETSGNITVSADFEKHTTIVATKPMFSRYVLYENAVENQSVVYHYVVRDIEEKTFNYDNLPYSEDVTFEIPGYWNKSNIGAVVFVQVEDNEEILQSANYVFEPVPVVYVTTSIDGKEISEVSRIEGTASEDVHSVEVRIDDQLYKTAEGTSSWYFDVNPSQLSGGEHTLTVRAYSDSIIYSDPVDVTFTVKDDLLLYLLIVIVVVVIVAVVVAIVVLRSRKKKHVE